MDKLAAGPTPLKVGDKLAEGARLPNPSAQQVRAAVTEFAFCRWAARRSRTTRHSSTGWTSSRAKSRAGRRLRRRF